MIRDCVSVTTFTDNDIICRIWSNRRFPSTDFIQPVSNNLPQQIFLSTHPVLDNPSIGSVVPVTSENYFDPTTPADVPSGVPPFVPESTAIYQVFLIHQTTGSIVAG